MDTDPNTWMRVRLDRNLTDCEVTAQGGLNVDPLGLLQNVRVRVSQGHFWINDYEVDGTEILLSPAPPHVFSLDGSRFRGRLRLRLHSERPGFMAINEVPLESYLAGVVGAEMPAYWEPQALQAQTIASRSYCLHIKERFGKHRAWDLNRSQAHQVYRGVQAESAPVWQALQATYGQVLALRIDHNALLPAYYSAICGGHTEASERVFGGGKLSLAAVSCSYCAGVARLKDFYWPMVTLRRDEVNRRLLARYPTLKKLGSITDMVPMEQSDYPGFTRLTRVRLMGATGQTDNLRAEDLRLALDPSGRRIRSTIFVMKGQEDQWIFQQGRGWGHGVGLCQYGAQGMARQGKSAQEILNRYYPEGEVVCLDSP